MSADFGAALELKEAEDCSVWIETVERVVSNPQVRARAENTTEPALEQAGTRPVHYGK